MPARKRPNRKRKRRAVSISSSSSDDSSSSDNDSTVEKRTLSVINAAKTKANQDEESDSDSSSSSSDESHTTTPAPNASSRLDFATEKGLRPRSPSPGPLAPSTLRIPSFLPGKATLDAKESERVLQEKFTKFWMNSIVEGFKDDLEIIRKDPALTTSKLSMLIDSLSSGAEIWISC
ncbi:hypothetical protein J3R30DRAFT_414347 [Lentinula aciculospora]|uniref:Ribosome assembly protein 3 n=1 Tax=Lentinula aciculospora TaxID=153920 RepID=A0A9W9DM20_9AGAR|nr:hypothetical protein J3R30DRAFT_414347 [Lentinula aciculospora]